MIRTGARAMLGKSDKKLEWVIMVMSCRHVTGNDFQDLLYSNNSYV